MRRGTPGRRSESLRTAANPDGRLASGSCDAEPVHPRGRLNDRQRAESEIEAALTKLGGEPWKTVSHFLRDCRSTAFLDRMHEHLAVAEPRRQRREAMAWRWWGRHEEPSPSAEVRLELVRRLGWGQPLNEAASYRRVSAVSNSTVRASSAVEYLNSVLRLR